MFWKYAAKFTGEHPCWSVSVFSCKSASYFQNTFYKEHLWAAASVSFWTTVLKETSSAIEATIYPGRVLFPYHKSLNWSYRSSRSEAFLVKGVLKVCSNFTIEHSGRSVISIKLHCNFIETTLRHGCSPVNLLYIFRTPFPKNDSGSVLLNL